MTHREWLCLFLAYVVIVAFFAVTIAAHGQTPHDRFHYVYEGWLTEGYEVQIGGEWRNVPAIAVRPYTSPDGDAHVCVWHGNILCFVPGSGA